MFSSPSGDRDRARSCYLTDIQNLSIDQLNLKLPSGNFLTCSIINAVINITVRIANFILTQRALPSLAEFKSPVISFA